MILVITYHIWRCIIFKNTSTLTSFRFHLIPLRSFLLDIIYQYFISFKYLISSSGTNKSIMSEDSLEFIYPRLGYHSFKLIFLFETFYIWNRLIYHAPGTVENHLHIRLSDKDIYFIWSITS